MDRLQRINPFARRESHSPSSVTTYKVLTVLSWLLSAVVTIYYAVEPPRDGRYHRGTIWHQNHDYHTGFSLNPVITSIYWLILLPLQLLYITDLFSASAEVVTLACAVGSHFIVNNLLHFAFIMLFVRSHFILAEVMLLLNFVNLTALYFRHGTRTFPGRVLVHLPVVSGPLAWTYVAVFWNGAIMVGKAPAEGLAARLLANVFVWSLLGWGLFYVLVYRDYTLGFALSLLAASLGVAQFLRQVVALQWIFAFTIMAVLFLLTMLVAVPAWLGRERPPQAQTQTQTDAERAPLLAEN
ncbi:hypothetical protein VTK26DRAFT_2997 [Humicola hyalothermophila]